MSNHRRFVSTPITVTVLTLMAVAGAQAQSTLHVLRPINGATVRETVPIKIAPTDIPAEGYVSITIDGQFKTARALPGPNEPVYLWDTKAAYTTPDDPDTKKFVKDGDHTLDISIFSGSKLVGQDTVTVKVANSIAIPAQGIQLTYKWHMDESMRYHRETTLDDVTGGANASIQTSSVDFTRSVEDASGGTFLVRDRVLPGGTVVNHAVPAYVETTYNLKSDYRTMNPSGEIVERMAPLTPGDHFGFSVPVLPGRRISIGDSWQGPVELTLQWASSFPATVIAESRLEGFEWQNGYPTARIRETYSGPATFAGLNGGPDITIDDIKFERIVSLAYNSGRLIRTLTTMDVTANLSPEAMTTLGLTGAGAAGAGAPQPGFGGPPPGFGGPPPGFGGPPPGFGGPGGGFNPNMPPAGVDAGPAAGIKLHITEDTDIIP